MTIVDGFVLFNRCKVTSKLCQIAGQDWKIIISPSKYITIHAELSNPLCYWAFQGDEVQWRYKKPFFTTF